MTYRHRRTGVVINTPCRLEGPDWEDLTEADTKTPEAAPAEQAKKPAPKRKAKVTG